MTGADDSERRLRDAQQAIREGDYARAIAILIDLAARAPDRIPVQNSLGIAYSLSGDTASAIDCFRQVLALDPGNASACNNLGHACLEAGNADEAVGWFRKSLAARPGSARTHANLGKALARLGKFGAAIESFQRALEIEPGNPDAAHQLGNAQFAIGATEAAVATFRDLARDEPRRVGLNNSLGTALVRLGHITEAIACFRREIDISPEAPAARNGLGNALRSAGRLDAALDAYRSALELRPDYAIAHSNLLYTLQFDPDSSEADLYRAAVEFGDRHDRRPPASTQAGDRDPGRTLRIGYLSPDFRYHSVAQFTAGLFGHHDRGQFEIFAYSNVRHPDGMTRHFESQADQWRTVSGLDDTELANRIRADGIDVLVELAGHTGGNRLTALASQPAPVQMTWLGYPGTTGLPAIGYRITDAIADPPGAADRWHSETLVRLESGFLCYQMGADQPDIAPAPAPGRGHVTFGSFNNLTKVTAPVIETWAAILAAVPDSRLLLKADVLIDRQVRAAIADGFANFGIDAGRIEMSAWLADRNAHLGLYEKVDIALDPFPYNGTTTTCEALWMGVPVVALCGDRHAGRVGASILHHAGLPELVAADLSAYRSMAIALADDAGRLRTYRQTLRGRLRNSRLMDLDGFVAGLQQAYRSAWRRWCRG